jgi:low temperature requirement protein LtrA
VQPGEEVRRVTTLELFFDLVFVFAVTQLSSLLGRDLSPRGLVRVLLLFGVLWWMYGGYGWLTNTMPPDQGRRRLLLLVGMAGFMVVALATPRAFEDTGLAWGVGYLVVVLVHAALYAQSNRSILRILPFNLLAATLVIAAGLLRGPAVYVLWTAASRSSPRTSWSGTGWPCSSRSGSPSWRSGSGCRGSR